jgi:predicted signal transduction protein with EAL and GGDEF domain
MIVRATTELGRNLGLRVVAEGVETRTAWDQLVAMRCDVAQGYYLSRPIPAQEITRWMALRELDRAGAPEADLEGGADSEEDARTDEPAADARGHLHAI